MLGRLFQLAAIAIVLYYGYTVGLPWARENLDSLRSEPAAEDQAAEEAVACVAEARRANDRFASEVTEILRPPVDQAVWGSILVGLGGSIGGAESTCGCPHEACLRAGEAMYELRQLLSLFDDMVNGRSQTFANPAVLQERVDRLLDEAWTLAGA